MEAPSTAVVGAIKVHMTYKTSDSQHVTQFRSHVDWRTR